MFYYIILNKPFFFVAMLSKTGSYISDRAAGELHEDVPNFGLKLVTYHVCLRKGWWEEGHKKWMDVYKDYMDKKRSTK